MAISTQGSTQDSAQVRIQLTTQDEEIKIADDTGSILVSTGLGRYALSTLVNNLLDREKAVPFEFLINGQFLQTNIDTFISSHGLSTESTLSLEYVRALLPLANVSTFEHDDWVSSVDVLSPSAKVVGRIGSQHQLPSHAQILSGSYDGLLRLWSSSGDLIGISDVDSAGPQPAIKAVSFLTPDTLVSAGNDRVVKIWKTAEKISSEADPHQASRACIRPILELYGHQSGVCGIATHTPSSRILSASSDHCIGLWSTQKSQAPAASQALVSAGSLSGSKKRKLNPSSRASVAQRGPLSLLKGHSDVVTAVSFAFKDPTVAYSTSLDHVLATWDLTTGARVSNRQTMHPLLCLAELPELGLLAAGSSARHISMIDPRVDARHVSGLTLRGHTNSVSSVDSQPDKAWGLVSASYDGTCRIWDLRNSRTETTSNTTMGGKICQSLYVIARDDAKTNQRPLPPGAASKVFSVRWDQHGGIVSAGEDKRVQINQGQPPEHERHH